MSKYKVEPFDLWQYSCKVIYEPLIRCRIDFSSRLDERILKEAVDLSFDAIPLLKCRFDNVGFRPRWIESDFTGEDIVHIVETGLDAHYEIGEALSSNIDFAAEPQLKLYVVRRPFGDTLCFIINHMICDAAGFKEYLYLLCDLYTKLVNGLPAKAPASAERGCKPLFAGISLHEKLRIFRSHYGAYDSINKEEQVGVTFQENCHKTFMETHILTSEKFERLKAFGKRKSVTINDLIMTAYARVFCKVTATNHIMIPSTIDLRKFIPEGISYGITNYSTNCMCNLSILPLDTFTDTLKQVSTQMQAYKSNRNVLKSVMLWKLVVKLMPFRFLVHNYTKFISLPVISFTNLGILDDSRLIFGDAAIESAYMTAAIKSNPYFQITASTYRECCTLGCNIYGGEHDQKWIQAFLEDVGTELSSQSKYEKE